MDSNIPRSLRERQRQHILFRGRGVAAVLGFEYYGRFDDFEAVPDPGGDVYSVSALVAVEPDARSLVAALVVEHHIYLPAQQQLRLGSAAVTVHGNFSAFFEGVEHPLRAVFRGVAQVAVHPQTRGSLRLACESIKESVVDQHGFSASFDLRYSSCR